MTDGYDDRFGLGGYFPEVVSKGEDRPVVVDRAEVSILVIVEDTVRDERGANGDVITSLVGRMEILSVLLEDPGVAFLDDAYRRRRVECRAIYSEG